MAATAGFNDRQKAVISMLQKLGQGRTAGELAAAADLGDPRGVAQTIRRMPEYIEKGAAGYKLTRKGQAAARKLAE